jgi:hypothetical protein
MSTHDPIPENPEDLAHAKKLGYEHRDLTTGDFGKPSLWFAVFGFFSLAVAWGFLALGSRVLSGQSMDDRTAPAARRTVPPEPMIQSGPKAKADIKDLRVREQEHLNSYGWVDQSKGIARVPIDEALKMAAAQGIDPAPANSATPAAEAVR